jgi:hypothetical protein
LMLMPVLKEKQHGSCLQSWSSISKLKTIVYISLHRKNFGSNIIRLARKKHNRPTMHPHWGIVKTSKRNRNSERVSEQADAVCCFDPFSFSSDPLKCAKSLLQGSLSHGCMCLVDHTTSATKIGPTGFSQHFATRLVEWWYNENMSWTKRYLLTFKFGNYNFWLFICTNLNVIRKQKQNLAHLNEDLIKHSILVLLQCDLRITIFNYSTRLSMTFGFIRVESLYYCPEKKTSCWENFVDI